LKLPARDPATGGWELAWSAPGRVFQVEAAIDPTGPFTPVSSIGIETRFRLSFPEKPPSGQWWRVRQW